MSIPIKYKLSKYIRAGSEGKLIHCPKCDYPTKVSFFNWSKLKCWKCKDDIKKKDWSTISKYEYGKIKNKLKIKNNGRNN